MDWLQKYIFPAEAKTVSPEFVRAGTAVAALEMIESGTTTYADMYYFEEEIARATGPRASAACSARTIIQFPFPTRKHRPSPSRGRNGSPGSSRATS
jgi:5-methylthioadenosine/S-adenosylhomocysteine deaminase